MPQVQLYLFLLSNLLFWFGDNLLLLSEDHLDVAGRAHVGVDAAVGAVGASPHLGGLVDLDVLDDKGIHIETLFIKKDRLKTAVAGQLVTPGSILI